MLSLFFNLHLCHSLLTISYKKPCAVWFYNRLELTAFFHLGLELSIPGQCLLLMLITVRVFLDGTPKYSPFWLSGKHCTAPISNSKWKDKWGNVLAGSAWFPAENVSRVFVFGSAMLLQNGRLFGFFREIAARFPERNSRYQMEVQATLSLLSRLYLLTWIGLKRLDWRLDLMEKKRGLWNYKSYSSKLILHQQLKPQSRRTAQWSNMNQT